jgi:hypothetical protein
MVIGVPVSNPYLVQGLEGVTEKRLKNRITVATDELKNRKLMVAKSKGVMNWYIRFGNAIFNQIHMEGFSIIEALSIANVCAMLLFVAWDVHFFSASDGLHVPPRLLTIGRWVNTVLFYAEFAARIASEGFRPLMMFKRNDRMWRLLDVANLILNSTSGRVAVYRVLVGFKIIEYVIQDSPKMRVLFYSIIHGMKRLLGICCFILFVAYLYAILGMYLFRETNPFNFGSLTVAISTVGVLGTFEDWSEMFYTSYYGCGTYSASVYLHQPIDNVCDESLVQPNKYYTTVYFVSYVCISIFLLSLFVSTLTLQLAQSYKEVKEEHALYTTFTHFTLHSVYTTLPIHYTPYTLRSLYTALHSLYTTLPIHYTPYR